MSISCLMWSCCHLLFSTSWHLRTYHSARHSQNAWNFINWKLNFKENIFNKYQGEKITKDVIIIRIESYFSAFHRGMKCRENYRIQLCIIRKNTQPSPPLLTPKSWKNGFRLYWPHLKFSILKVRVCHLQTKGLPCKHYFSHMMSSQVLIMLI